MKTLLHRAAAALTLLMVLGLALVARFDWIRFEGTLNQRQTLLARVLADQTSRYLDLAVLAGAQTGLRLLEDGRSDESSQSQALRTALAYQGEVRALTLIDETGLVLASTEAADVGLRLPLDAWRKNAYPNRQGAWLGPLLHVRGLADLQGGPVPPGRELLPLLQSISSGDRGWLLLTQLNPERFATDQLQTLSGQQDAVALLLRTDGQPIVGSVEISASASWGKLAPLTRFLPAQEFGQWSGDGLRPGTQHAAFRLVRGWPLLTVVESGQSDAIRAWWDQSGDLLLACALAGAALIAALLLAARVQSGREHALVQRDHARAEATAREEQLQVIVQSLQEAVFRTDEDGRVAFVSDQVERLTGRMAAAWVGRPLVELAALPQRAKLAALMNEGSQQATAQEAKRMLLDFQDPDNDQVHFLDISLRALRRDGRLLGYAGSLGDATGRVRAQRSLQAQLSFLQQELEVSPLPTSVVDLQHRYVFVNHAWEQFHGRDRSEVLGTLVGFGLSAAQRSLHESMDAELVTSGKPVRYEARMPGIDGREHDLIVFKILLPGDSQQGPRIVTKTLDVTELRDAERANRDAREAAEEASKLKSEFIANISHELRTPLQSIIGFSELGGARSAEQPRLQRMFVDIHGAGRRMLHLVNDLLDVARLDSSVGSIQLQDAELSSLIAPVAEELAPLLTARSLTLSVDMPTQATQLRVDAARLQQVLRNLLANAIKFSPPGSHITLRAHGANGGLCFQVDDEGPGIPEAELEAIFEPFTQSSRTKDGSGGTGLGLTISRKIAQAHGGRLWAENRQEGGARFVLELP
ncbi:MAG: PAS domain S-box protein [Burkholderiales bacterium]|nr:PAS domain S-box protein [Burkholderiales bacterium]